MRVLILNTADGPNAIPAYRMQTHVEYMVKTYGDTAYEAKLVGDFNRLVLADEIDRADVVLGNYQVPMGLHLFDRKSATAHRKLPPRLWVSDPEKGLIGKSPAVVVMDIDDDIANIHPWNTSYHLVGRYGPNGEALSKSDKIQGKGPDGQAKDIWVPNERYGDDRESIFNVCVSRTRLRRLVGSFRAVNGVVAASERLATSIHSETGVRPFVMPNMVKRTNYPKWQSPARDYPLILWRGGSSHYGDMLELIKPVSAALKRHPEARLILFGQDFPKLYEQLPEGQWEYVSWVPFDSYHATLRNFGHNIVIGTLEDTPFSRCKTPILWYENSALAYPAATLAKGIPPFSDEMVDGETGLLYNSPEEFGEKLSLLIEQEELRLRLAQAAHEWVWKNRGVDVVTPKVRSWYESLIEDQRRETMRRHALVAKF